MRSVALLFLLAASLPSTARAERSEVHLAGTVGAEAGDQGAVTLGAMGLYRNGWLGVGGTLDYGSGLLNKYSLVSAGPAVGVFLPTPAWLDIGLLGTAGLDSHSHAGSGFWSDDPGVSAMLPYLGARGVVAVQTGHSGFFIGVTGIAEHDIGTSGGTVTYTQHGLFSDNTTTQTGRHVVGEGPRLGLNLAIGGTIGR